jgi:GT2 family glycosyltransferase
LSDLPLLKISIIVLSYNSGAYIQRCLDALKPFDAEIVLADNGSAGFKAAALRKANPKVKVLPIGINLGFAGGNNRAVYHTTGDWLGFINPDAFADPAWYDAMRAAITANPDVAMFTSLQIDAMDARRMDGRGDGMTFFGFPYRAGFGRPVPPRLKSVEVFSPCGAAFVIRRDLFEALGGFDERFFCYCEDADLGFRARLLGHRCLFVPEAQVAHIGSASTGVRSDFALYHGYRNRIWLYLKNMPLALLIPTLPIHIALTLIGAIKDSITGRGRPAWRGIGDAFKGLGPIFRSREHIQASRQIKALRLAKVLTWNPFRIARRD